MSRAQLLRTYTSMLMCLTLLFVLGGPVLGADTDPPPPPPKPAQGCTPGYWKNHTEQWGAVYTPIRTLGATFAIAGVLSSLSGVSLLDALSFGGGSGVLGAAQILLRAAVAALLNAADPGVNYAFSDSPADVISFVNGALASGSRGDMLAAASQLDTFNNLGCPLN